MVLGAGNVPERERPAIYRVKTLNVEKKKKMPELTSTQFSINKTCFLPTCSEQSKYF